MLSWKAGISSVPTQELRESLLINNSCLSQHVRKLVALRCVKIPMRCLFKGRGEADACGNSYCQHLLELIFKKGEIIGLFHRRVYCHISMGCLSRYGFLALRYTNDTNRIFWYLDVLGSPCCTDSSSSNCCSKPASITPVVITP